MEEVHERIHHRSSRCTDIPCAMVLTGYVVLAPVRPAFVSPSLARHRSASLAPAARAPGPHAFAVRFPHRSSNDAIGVHRIPHSTYRDDAYAPLHRGGTGAENHDFPKIGIQIFFTAGLDKPGFI